MMQHTFLFLEATLRYIPLYIEHKFQGDF